MSKTSKQRSRPPEHSVGGIPLTGDVRRTGVKITKRGWPKFWSTSFIAKTVDKHACIAPAASGQLLGVAVPSRAFRSRPRSKKEVFQPHLPVRLPCYDLAPVTGFALGRSFRSRTSGTPSFHGLTGGVYKARERIHRAMADARLLANPTSRSRVADSDPN